MFIGTLSVVVAVGFASKFYGSLLVSIDIEAITIKTGIFIQYLKIECEMVCLNIGCTKVCVPIIK